MSCTDEKPCLMPILRWVHSDRCKKLSEQTPWSQKIPIFRARHDEIISLARKAGWMTSSPDLKVRWVETVRYGRILRLWFKSQAVYLGHGTRMKNARSLCSDPRCEDPGELLGRALECFEKWF